MSNTLTTQQYITIGKNTLVSGLLWLVLAKDKKITRMAKEEFKTSFYARYLPKNGREQVGFVVDAALDQVAELRGTRLFSLAAALTEQMIKIEPEKCDDFIAAIKVNDDLYAMVVRRNGVFIPEQDIMGDKDQVKQAYLKQIASRSETKNNRFAPVDWQISDSTELNFNDLFCKPNGQIDSRKIKKALISSTGLDFKKPLIVMLVLVLGYSGYVMYNHLNKPKAPPVDLNAFLKAQSKQKPKPTPPIWASEVDPVKFWSQCRKSINSIKLFPSGWLLTNLSCSTDNGFSADWKKTELGTIGGLEAQVPKVSFTIDGTKAKFKSKIANLPKEPIETLKDLPLLVDASLDLAKITAANHLGLSLTVDKGSAKQKSNLPGQASKPASKNYSIIHFSVSSELLPVSKVIRLINRPGMRLEAIYVKDKVGSWVVKGVQYAK